MTYQTKPVTIEAITLDELVAYGKALVLNVVNGMPWSFIYAGQPITHENDDCYLIPTIHGLLPMTRDDMLVTDANGDLYPVPSSVIHGAYDAVRKTDDINNEQMEEMVEKLNEFAPLEGSEVGEYWLMLVDLWEDYEYMLTPPFRSAICAEIAVCVDEIAKYYQVVEEEETPRPPRMVKRLAYIG